MSKFSMRLRELRNSKDISQQRLSEYIGSSKSSINMYERGEREPGIETLEAIADFFNVDMDYLLGKTDIKNRYALAAQQAIMINNIMPLPKMQRVPLLGYIACGEPILADENIDGYINMPEDVEGTFALRCKGDSMINARIYDGDIVFIRQQDDVDDGQIAAVLIGTDATLKRVKKLPNKLVLSPCNPMYDDMIYTNEQLDEIHILGKAVYFLSAVR